MNAIKWHLCFSCTKDEALANNTPVALGFHDKDFVLINGEGKYCLELNFDGDVSFQSDMCNHIVAEDVHIFTNEEIERSTLYAKILKIKLVKNDKSPATKKGLCWAATIAMKANFQLTRVYNAMSIYNITQFLFMRKPLGV